MKILFKLTDGLVNCSAVLGCSMQRLPVRRTEQNDSLVIENYSMLYTAQFGKMCKFENVRGVDVFEAVLLDIKATMFGFE